MTTERPEAFEFFGPRTLSGPALAPGDPAPDFALVSNRFETVRLADFAGRPLVLSVVPSLDTGVCTKQSLRFNQAAAELGDKASFVTVSADLPFAQARWCDSNSANAIRTLSDHRDMSFGSAYGTLVGDFRIESRAVFVIGPDGTLRYAEYVPHVAHEPNYDAALAALEGSLG